MLGHGQTLRACVFNNLTLRVQYSALPWSVNLPNKAWIHSWEKKCTSYSNASPWDCYSVIPAWWQDAWQRPWPKRRHQKECPSRQTHLTLSQIGAVLPSLWCWVSSQCDSCSHIAHLLDWVCTNIFVYLVTYIWGSPIPVTPKLYVNMNTQTHIY